MRKTSSVAVALLTSVALLSACSTSAADNPTGAPSAVANPFDPSLSPITVGFDNIESASYSLFQVRVGFEAGLKYVNGELAGVNGHELKAFECKTDLTPASAVNCANQFVQQKVVVNAQGANTGGNAAIPILREAGIRSVIMSGSNAGMDAAKGQAFNVEPSSRELYVALPLLAQKLKAKSVVFAMSDQPAYRTFVSQVLEPTARAAGLNYSISYFPSTESDWTTRAATFVAKGPDAVFFPVATDHQCSGFIPALRTVGFAGPIFAGVCQSAIAALSPSDANDVITGPGTYTPDTTGALSAKVKAEIAIFKKYLGQQTEAKPDNLGLAYLGFGLAVNLADMLRQVKGDITTDSVAAALPTVTGPLFLTDQRYDCSGAKSWPNTSSCTTGIVFTRFNDKGEQTVPDFNPVDTKAYWPAA